MAFLRKDFSVVALYMETCDGVPDHAAEMRRQLAKHRLAYSVLDAEAGPIDDPTRKRFPWAPHAVVVDNKGRVLRTYGHMPRMRTLREDIDSLVATGLFPERPDDGWREFTRNAWVDVRIEGDGRPRTEKRVLKLAGRDWSTVQIGAKEEKFFHEHLDRNDRDYSRTERKPETLLVDGRKVTARVFDARWKRLARSVARAGEVVDLTHREFELLECLMRHAGQVVSREALARDVWKETMRATPLDNVIDVHVARLRKKIDHDGRVRHSHTVRGVGFVLRAENA